LLQQKSLQHNLRLGAPEGATQTRAPLESGQVVMLALSLQPLLLHAAAPEA
jgi:hypothetical protein